MNKWLSGVNSITCEFQLPDLLIHDQGNCVNERVSIQVGVSRPETRAIKSDTLVRSLVKMLTL